MKSYTENLTSLSKNQMIGKIYKKSLQKNQYKLSSSNITDSEN
jgi:hypothetical protein